MGKFGFWFNNARPISLPQSMLPALTAVALSAGLGSFSWIAAIACVFGVMFAHLGMNLLDDWFDYYKAYFSDAFKKETGFSPLEYRKRITLG